MPIAPFPYPPPLKAKQHIHNCNSPASRARRLFLSVINKSLLMVLTSNAEANLNFIQDNINLFSRSVVYALNHPRMF